MPDNPTWFAEVLPHRPPPYPGECISGYLVRLAEANGFTAFWDLARDLFPRLHKVAQLPLLHWEYPVDNWGRIPIRTQLSPAQLRAMSVAPWVEKFRPPVVLRSGHRRGPGQWLHGVVRPDLAVCPQCLQTEPYVRLLWRLMPARVCLTHGCWLQESCPQCGHALRVISTTQPHLRCAACGMDLRRLPIVPAPEDLLRSQTRCQADLQFLLNPQVSLVPVPSAEAGGSALNLSQALGLKFRFLRRQADFSMPEVGKRLGVTKTMVGLLERGRYAPLALYWSYLEVFSLSWLSFAGLPLPPPSTLERARAHFSLRVCPNPECPNHPAPSERVTLEEDLPASQKVRFSCSTCGRHFTRRYDGQLATRDPALLRPLPALGSLEFQDEVAHLLELGRQGLSNQQIATRLGWAVSTVSRYWRVLGVEAEIHQAQNAQRLREKQARHAAVRARVEQVLQALFRRGEKITLARVIRESQSSEEVVRHDLGLAEHIRRMAQAHNPSVRQRRVEALRAQLMQVLADWKPRGQILSIEELAERIGSNRCALIRASPQMYATVRQAVRDYNASLKLVRRQKECAQINEAAARLVAQGIRLSRIRILNEAGMCPYRTKADPVLRELLDRWTDNPI